MQSPHIGILCHLSLAGGGLVCCLTVSIPPTQQHLHGALLVNLILFLSHNQQASPWKKRDMQIAAEGCMDACVCIHPCPLVTCGGGGGGALSSPCSTSSISRPSFEIEILLSNRNHVRISAGLELRCGALLSLF